MQPTRSPQTQTSPSDFDGGFGDTRARTIGLWSALAFVLSLVALDVAETAAIIAHDSFSLLVVLVSLFVPPSFVVMLAALHLSVPPSKRIWSLLGLVFGSMWATVSVSAYFLQLTVVRFGLASREAEGLSMITFSNQHSAGWALNNLGWGLFLGLAALLIAPVFGATRRGRVSRWLFVVGGFAMFALLIGYAASWSMVYQTGAIVGWLVALPIAGLVTAWVFRSGTSADLE